MFIRSIDSNEIECLKPQEWQVKMLERNPGYVSWGNNEDYMGSGSGWSEHIEFNSWSNFDFQLDELNELVNFYFFIHVDSVKCPNCQTGYCKEYEDKLYEYYNSDNYKLSPVQKKNLVKAGRVTINSQKIFFSEKDQLWYNVDYSVSNQKNVIPEPSYLWSDDIQFSSKFPKKYRGPNNPEYFGDSIDVNIIISSLIDGDIKCKSCNGYSKIKNSEPMLGIHLWFLHPRKGASRGVLVK